MPKEQTRMNTSEQLTKLVDEYRADDVRAEDLNSQKISLNAELETVQSTTTGDAAKLSKQASKITADITAKEFEIGMVSKRNQERRRLIEAYANVLADEHRDHASAAKSKSLTEATTLMLSDEIKSAIEKLQAVYWLADGKLSWDAILYKSGISYAPDLADGRASAEAQGIVKTEAPERPEALHSAEQILGHEITAPLSMSRSESNQKRAYHQAVAERQEVAA